MRRSKADKIARRSAQAIAETLGVELVARASYTFQGTRQAAGWRVKGNRYRARIAVNVEDIDQPVGILETGPLNEPVSHETYLWHADLGWLAHPLFSTLGSLHPILR